MVCRHAEVLVAPALRCVQMAKKNIQSAAMQMAERHEAMDATGVDGQAAAWMAARVTVALLIGLQIDHHRLCSTKELTQFHLKINDLIDLLAFGQRFANRRRWCCVS